MTAPTTDPVATIDWRERAAHAEIGAGMLVGGELRAATDGATRAVHSARDGSVLVDLAWAQPADADAAVAAAREAFDRGRWPRMHARERGEILQEFARLVEAHRDEIALLISLEMGKPIRTAYEIELRALIRCLRFYGELADKESGDIPHTTEGELALVTREPAGVVAAVVPWNFPLTLGGWKFAPALAAGCTVVLKTAEQSPLSMQRVAELGVQAGLPAGVFNVLSGDGATVGRRLGEHPDVDVLTFTGSTDVGRHFLRYAADSNLKRVYLELGGKSPNLIFPDAPDLDAAADSAAWAIFFNSGEMCTAGSRLVVHTDVAEQVVQRIVDTAAQWFPADPLLPETQMGPLVDQRRLERVLGASAAGARPGRTAADRRTAGPDRDRRRLPRADGGHRCRAGQRAGPGRDLRPGADRADRRRRGRSRPGGRGHAVRAGGRGLDPRSRQGAPDLPRAPGRHGLGQLLRGRGHERPLRRGEAVRLRPGQVAARAG